MVATSDELDLARPRTLARKKPRTKAGQVRQAWPEIRELLAAGHTLKGVCTWVNEIGIEIGYARLSDYVNQLRRAKPDFRHSGHAMPTVPPITPPTTVPMPDVARTEQTHPSTTHWQTCAPAKPTALVSITAPPYRRKRKT